MAVICGQLRTILPLLPKTRHLVCLGNHSPLRPVWEALINFLQRWCTSQHHRRRRKTIPLAAVEQEQSVRIPVHWHGILQRQSKVVDFLAQLPCWSLKHYLEDHLPQDRLPQRHQVLLRAEDLARTSFYPLEEGVVTAGMNSC